MGVRKKVHQRPRQLVMQRQRPSGEQVGRPLRSVDAYRESNLFERPQPPMTSISRVVITDAAGAESLIEAEAGAIAHMNQDHSEALRLYASKLLGAEDGPWRLTGLDPEGVDLALNDATLRLPFPQRVATADDLRRALVNLAPKARGK